MEGNQVLAVNGLTVSYYNDNQYVTATKGVSFSLYAGQTLGIVGESGSGKSTVALALMGLLPSRCRVSGEVMYRTRQGETQSLLGLGERALRRFRGREVAMVFQEPMTSLNPVLTCGRQVAEVLMARGLPRSDADSATADLLRTLSIRNPEAVSRTFPHRVSGGEQQRVVIAMALAGQPAVLIADEPATALDTTTQASILRLLKDRQEENRMAMVFITHDIDLLAGLATDVLVMHAGQVVEAGPVNTVFRRPQHPYTQRLLSSRTLSVSRPAHNAPASTGPVLEVRGVTRRFTAGTDTSRRSFTAVDDVSFDLMPGETFGLVGASGSGKTTLCRILLGLSPPDAGTVYFDGAALDPRRRSRDVRRAIQAVFQDPYATLNPRMRVGEMLAEPLRTHRLTTHDRVSGRVAELLEAVGLDASLAARYPHALSAGQRQRIGLARALALEPRVIVCAEPVSSLDAPVRAQVLSLMADLKSRFGLGYVLVSHDLAVVRAMSDRMAVMHEGRFVETGTPEAVCGHPKTDVTRRLLEAAPHLQQVHP